MFELVYDDGRTDGRRLDGYTISSPCEPNGSGELKTLTLISDPLDEDRLLKLLYSMIRDSIRMYTNAEYICTSNLLLFGGMV